MDNQIDTTTGTVKLRAIFDNADDALFPNQFVNAKLTVDTVRDAPIVPTAAILRGTPGTYVYLMQGDDKVAVRPIKLGEADGARTVVVEGLNVGDRVVVDGTDRLRDGASVRVTETGGKAVPAPAPRGSRSGNAGGRARPAGRDGRRRQGGRGRPRGPEARAPPPEARRVMVSLGILTARPLQRWFRGSPLLEGEGQGEMCDLSGDGPHLTPTLSFQGRERVA